jgi:hypothetical protein
MTANFTRVQNNNPVAEMRSGFFCARKGGLVPVIPQGVKLAVFRAKLFIFKVFLDALVLSIKTSIGSRAMPGQLTATASPVGWTVVRYVKYTLQTIAA